MKHLAPAPAHYPSTAHHGGHGLLDTLMNGFLWRMGSDAASTLFHSAPTAFAAVIVVALVVAVVRRLRHRNQF